MSIAGYVIPGNAIKLGQAWRLPREDGRSGTLRAYCHGAGKDNRNPGGDGRGLPGSGAEPDEHTLKIRGKRKVEPYRLYIDEVGNHSMSPNTLINETYLTLFGLF